MCTCYMHTCVRVANPHLWPSAHTLTPLEQFSHQKKMLWYLLCRLSNYSDCWPHVDWMAAQAHSSKPVGTRKSHRGRAWVEVMHLHNSRMVRSVNIAPCINSWPEPDQKKSEAWLNPIQLYIFLAWTQAKPVRPLGLRNLIYTHRGLSSEHSGCGLNGSMLGAQTNSQLLYSLKQRKGTNITTQQQNIFRDAIMT